MSELGRHPFTGEREQHLVEGARALNELGYFSAARAVETVLEEQRRARALRIHRAAAKKASS